MFKDKSTVWWHVIVFHHNRTVTQTSVLTACCIGPMCLCPSHSSPSLSPQYSTSHNRTYQQRSPLKNQTMNRDDVTTYINNPALSVIEVDIKTFSSVIESKTVLLLTFSPQVLALSVFGLAPPIEATPLDTEEWYTSNTNTHLYTPTNWSTLIILDISYLFLFT